MTIHRGTVISNLDPTGSGRLQVVVPTISTEPLSWALPVIPLGVAPASEPLPLGTEVWVTFENDDPAYPVVLGTLG